MTFTLTVRDETAAGESYHEVPLEFPSERITVRDLIRERVYQEVQDTNSQQGERVFRGLVQPTDTERVLNGHRAEYRLASGRQIDWKEQYEKAIEAFDRNGYLVIVDDRQATRLDQEFVVGPRTTVSFVKLTLLVGG